MVDLGFLNNSPLNIGSGIKNPFASSPSLVNNAPKQNLQKKLADPVASEVPNESTVAWPKFGGITPSANSLTMLKKSIPEIPKFQTPISTPVIAAPTSSLPVSSIPAPLDYGTREDGTPKGNGFFGPLQRKDGSNDVSTEISIWVKVDGKEMTVPALVPTLSEQEKDYLLATPINKIFTQDKKMASSIETKASSFAKQRIAEGKSVFAQNGEDQTTTQAPDYSSMVTDAGQYPAWYTAPNAPTETTTKPTLPVQSPAQSPLNTNIWATQFNPGIQNTSVAWLPDTTKQSIATDVKNNKTQWVTNNIDYSKALADLSASLQDKPNANVSDIKRVFPEFEWLDDQVVADLSASLKAKPDATKEQILAAFPELTAPKENTVESESPILAKWLQTLESYNGPGSSIVKWLAGYIREMTQSAIQTGKWAKNIAEKWNKVDLWAAKDDVAQYLFEKQFWHKRTPGNKQDATDMKTIYGTVDQSKEYKDYVAKLTTEQWKIDNSNTSENVLDVAEGGLWVWFSTFAPTIMASMNIAWQTKVWWAALWAFGYVLNKWGSVITMVPWLKQFKESLPENRRADFDSYIGNMAFMLLMGTKWKKNIIKDPMQFIRDNIDPTQVINNFQNAILGIPGEALNKVEGIKEAITKKPGEWVDMVDRLIASTNDLDANTVSTFRSNPELMKAIDEWTVTKEWLKQELMDIADEANNSKSEAGAAYQEMYKSDQTFKPAEILQDIQDNLKDKWAIFDDKWNIVDFDSTNKHVANTPVWEKNLIKSEYNSARNTLEMKANDNHDLTVEEMHNIKKSLNNAIYTEWIEKKSSPLLKTIGEWVNLRLKDKVPWWKDVDKLFTERSTKVREIADIIFNRKWDFKGTLKALLWENQYKRLQELEKTYPGLTKKLEWIKAYDDYIRTRETQKTWAYGKVFRKLTGWWVGWTLWYSIAGPLWGMVWALIGAMISHKISDPALMKNILLRWIDSSGLTKKIGDGIRLTPQEKNLLKDNIENIIRDNVDIKNQKLKKAENLDKLQKSANPFKSLPSPETVTPSKMGTPEQPIVAWGPVAWELVIDGRLRETSWYKDAPVKGDQTKLWVVESVRHTGGWFPTYEVKIEGYPWYKKLSEVGWVYEPTKTVDTPKEVMPRDEPAIDNKSEKGITTEKFWDRKSAYLQSALDYLNIKSLDDLPENLQQEVLKTVNQWGKGDMGKLWDKIDILKTKIDEYLSSKETNGNPDTTTNNNSDNGGMKVTGDSSTNKGIDPSVKKNPFDNSTEKVDSSSTNKNQETKEFKTDKELQDRFDTFWVEGKDYKIISEGSIDGYDGMLYDWTIEKLVQKEPTNPTKTTNTDKPQYKVMLKWDTKPEVKSNPFDTNTSNPTPQVKKIASRTTEEWKFSVYDIDKTHTSRWDMFTVHEDPKGWIVRNALVPENMQNKGIATKFYRDMNLESIKKTGNPLRSTQPRKLMNWETVHELSKDGIRLWEGLVDKWLAKKLWEKDYIMLKPEARVSMSESKTPTIDNTTSTTHVYQ